MKLVGIYEGVSRIAYNFCRKVKFIRIIRLICQILGVEILFVSEYTEVFAVKALAHRLGKSIEGLEVKTNGGAELAEAAACSLIDDGAILHIYRLCHLVCQVVVSAERICNSRILGRTCIESCLGLTVLQKTRRVAVGKYAFVTCVFPSIARACGKIRGDQY